MSRGPTNIVFSGQPIVLLRKMMEATSLSLTMELEFEGLPTHW